MNCSLVVLFIGHSDADHFVQLSPIVVLEGRWGRFDGWLESTDYTRLMEPKAEPFRFDCFFKYQRQKKKHRH